MFSDNKKYEFALLRAEGVSFNSINQKFNVAPGILSGWAVDLSGDICDIKIVANEYVADSLEASAYKRIPENQTKLHSFCIFLSILFYYLIVFSIPKMSYMKSM